MPAGVWDGYCGFIFAFLLLLLLLLLFPKPIGDGATIVGCIRSPANESAKTGGACNLKLKFACVFCICLGSKCEKCSVNTLTVSLQSGPTSPPRAVSIVTLDVVRTTAGKDILPWSLLLL